MIIYDLTCPHGHVFEGWFRDSGAFEREAAGLVCPLCGSDGITKAVQSPGLSRAGERKAREQAHQELARLGEKLLRECEYVGCDFSGEARRIHFGEAENRAIAGEASPGEIRELREEGIDCITLPWIRRGH